MPCLLLRAPLGHQHRSRMEQADEAHAQVGGTDTCHLLVEDELGGVPGLV